IRERREKEPDTIRQQSDKNCARDDERADTTAPQLRPHHQEERTKEAERKRGHEEPKVRFEIEQLDLQDFPRHSAVPRDHEVCPDEVRPEKPEGELNLAKCEE